MKILNCYNLEESAPLPVTGKLVIRHVSSRNCCQLYMGGRYVLGASGDTAEDALSEFKTAYKVEPGTVIEVLGYATKSTITA